MAEEQLARSGGMRHLAGMRVLLVLMLALVATDARAQTSPQTTELCRLYARDAEHAGCGICGGPGWRKANGRCARWDDVGPPDCRALRRELNDPSRCTRMRDRGRSVPR